LEVVATQTVAESAVLQCAKWKAPETLFTITARASRGHGGRIG